MFRGAFTALVTPFKNGVVDEEGFRKHIDWQIAEGINGIVPCGTTGESATMSHAEHRKVIEIAIDEARGRVPVIAGAGSNNTREAIELTVFAKDAGADAALLITPYYNKPTPNGMVAHFKAVADAAKLPIIAYNVPSRTGSNLMPETLAKIARVAPNVIGVKEATGSLVQASDVIEQCPEGFIVLSGEDATVLPLVSIGGHGVISVVSNVAPADMAGMVKSFTAGDTAEAKRLHYKLQPLVRAMFFETNPIPAKTALSLMGRMALEFRLPLCELTAGTLEKLKGELKAYGLIGEG